MYIAPQRYKSCQLKSNTLSHEYLCSYNTARSYFFTVKISDGEVSRKKINTKNDNKRVENIVSSIARALSRFGERLDNVAATKIKIIIIVIKRYVIKIYIEEATEQTIQIPTKKHVCRTNTLVL